jgi:hypothetical protein
LSPCLLGRRRSYFMSQRNIIAHAVQLKQNSPRSTGSAGANAQGQMQNRGPMAQPMQQQLSMQPQRVGKRSSTSPGEEVRSGHYLDIGQLIVNWFVSIEHYPETTSPRRIVSAHARLLRVLANSNSNSNSRNHNRNSRSTSTSTSNRSPNHRNRNSHNHNHSHHSSNSNNLRWRPLAPFRRVSSLCGACPCLAGRPLPVDLVPRRCIKWEWRQGL